MIKARFMEEQPNVRAIKSNGKISVFLCLNGNECSALREQEDGVVEDKYIEYDYSEFTVSETIYPLLGVEQNPDRFLNGYCFAEIDNLTDLQAVYTQYVQDKMDNAARSYPYRYDDIASAASYKGSTDPTFNAEGTAFANWRDKVWRKCFDILDEVLSGKRYLPTLEELDAELPKLELPNE